MTTEKDILDMYLHLRQTNNTIPSEALDFMKNVCLAAIKSDTETYVCNDFDLKLTDILGTKKSIKQSPNNSYFTIQIVTQQK